MHSGPVLSQQHRDLITANADLLDLGPRVLPGHVDARAHAGAALVDLARAYDPARGVPFRPYARALLPRRILDVYRREQSRALSTDLADLVDEQQPVDELLDPQLRAQLLDELTRAWATIPAVHRRALERLYVTGGRAPSRTARRHRTRALVAVAAILAAATGTGRGPRAGDRAALLVELGQL